jgi:hypothetical protein
VVMGVVPAFFLRPIEPAVDRLVQQVRRQQSTTADASRPQPVNRAMER